MAVIRQQRQVTLGRIGVVNMDTGADDVWQAVSNTANDAMNMIAPIARREAQQAGINAAKAVKRQNLITFDEQGNPKALTVPKEFGLIKRDAYMQVIERRFEESMREELINRSNELATKYSDPAKYNQMFGDYLKQMDKASDGRFNEYIANNGSAIMTETQGKLEIAQRKRQIAAAKEAARFNTYTALRKLEISRAQSVTPESVVELSGYAKAAQVAAQEEFALTGDRLQYIKTLDEIGFNQAGATVNLVINSAKFVSDSQREAIEAAIANPSFIGQIEDQTIRNQVSAVHQLSGGLGLDKLSTAFGAGADAIESIQTDRDSEWLQGQADTIETLESMQFATMDQAITAVTQWGRNAPEANKDDVASVMFNVAESFLKEAIQKDEGLKKRIEKNDSKAVEQFRLELKAAMSQNDPNSLDVTSLPPTIRSAVAQSLSLDPSVRQQLLGSIEDYLDPLNGIVKMLEDASRLDLEQRLLSLETTASTEFNTVDALITEAFESENYSDALDAYAKLVEHAPYLKGEQKTQFEKWTATLSDQVVRKQGGVYLKTVTRNEALYIGNEINAIQQPDITITEAQAIKTRVMARLESLVGEHGTSQIQSWRTTINTKFNDVVGTTKRGQEQVIKNDALGIVTGLRERAENNLLITSADLKKAKEEVAQKLGELEFTDDRAIADLHREMDGYYAVAQIQPLHRLIKLGTGGNGLAPEKLDNLIEIARNKDINALNAIPPDTIEYKIGKALFDATKPMAAKSEIRTQVGQLRDGNTKLWNAFQEKLDNVELKDQVTRLGSQATLEALTHYDKNVLAPLAGLAAGATIDYNNPELLRKDGQLTQFATELKNQLSRGVIPPSLKKYMDNAAQLGVVPNSNMFEIFNIANNSEFLGEGLSVLKMEGTVRLEPQTVARLGAAMLRYEAGMAETPEIALTQIVSQAQQLGSGSIRKSIEESLDIKIPKWIAETYPSANGATRAEIESAVIALGYDASSEKELKSAIKAWSDLTFGDDDKVIGLRLNEDAVSGSRTKYLSKSEIQDMNKAADQLVYDSMTAAQRAGLFTSSPAVAGGNMWTDQLVGEDGGVVYSRMDVRFKESNAAPGIYYLYAKTNMGYSQITDKDGMPLMMDAHKYKAKPKFHPQIGYYHTNWRSAIQADPNGGQQFQGWEDYATSLFMDVDGVGNVQPASQATVDAEKALMFARFPEMLSEPENMIEFERLIKKGVILKKHKESFLEFVND